MQRCTVTARLYGRCSTPVNTSLNWFMPALVNSSEVSSPGGTSEDEGTRTWPSCSKKSMKRERISRLVSMLGHPPLQVYVNYTLLSIPTDVRGKRAQGTPRRRKCPQRKYTSAPRGCQDSRVRRLLIRARLLITGHRRPGRRCAARVRGAHPHLLR